MDAAFEGKTQREWIELLKIREPARQCAAALALAELNPKADPAKNALLAALHDPEPCVQMAAQIAIDFVNVAPEFRRKMFDHLLSRDEEDQRKVLVNLEELAFSNLHGTASAPDGAAPSPATPPQPAAPAKPITPPPVEEVPEIVLVFRLSWWFQFGGIALCIGLSWLLRGLWWPRWIALSLTGSVLLFAWYAWKRREQGIVAAYRLRARLTALASAFVAGVCSFFILIVYPQGIIYIDNESDENLRLELDGAEWMTINGRGSTRRTLTKGTYRLTIRTVEGNQVRDEHDIQVVGVGNYVLNLLGAQVYFRGTQHYGSSALSPPPEIVNAKWFQQPGVDYLFEDLPGEVHSAAPQLSRTYITKRTPPLLMARDHR